MSLDQLARDDVRRLARARPQVSALAPAVEPLPISASRATGQPAPSTVGASSAIASPLTETSRSTHTTQAVSSDGLFVWTVPATITMTDANGQVVQFNYAAP